MISTSGEAEAGLTDMSDMVNRVGNINEATIKVDNKAALKRPALTRFLLYNV
ncbi:unnamed protein product [marine sediment metagenome]|uniref:Uncharacterized protein n=1 Tax=marine sediment metagenome TaxID=412755 RepID=X1NRD3_9ZZZZ